MQAILNDRLEYVAGGRPSPLTPGEIAILQMITNFQMDEPDGSPYFLFWQGLWSDFYNEFSTN